MGFPLLSVDDVDQLGLDRVACEPTLDARQPTVGSRAPPRGGVTVACRLPAGPNNEKAYRSSLYSTAGPWSTIPPLSVHAFGVDDELAQCPGIERLA